MTRRSSKAEKAEIAGASTFIVCTLLIVCACALIALVSGDVAAVLAVAVLGTIAALIARLMATAIAFELIR